MAQTCVYKLQPRGAFHFGERGVGIEETANILHSDTLFAAIVSAWWKMGRDGDALTRQALANPDAPRFRISSAFPYAGEVLFFPAPQTKLGEAKSLKKVRFVSEGALERLQILDKIDAEDELIQHGQVWVTPQERNQIQRDELWSREDESFAPHVAIDRVTSRSNVYYAGRITYARDCGLYFWAEFEDTAYQTLLEAALQFLEHEGLGGRRSTGHGQFTFRRLDRKLPQSADANYWMTLSLYYPRPLERRAHILRDAQYSLILRRGWIDSTETRRFRRKGVWMANEGSLFTGQAIGEVLDLRPDLAKLRLKPEERKPDHPIWRSGLAFPLPIRLAEVGQ